MANSQPSGEINTGSDHTVNNLTEFDLPSAVSNTIATSVDIINEALEAAKKAPLPGQFKAFVTIASTEFSFGVNTFEQGGTGASSAAILTKGALEAGLEFVFGSLGSAGGGVLGGAIGAEGGPVVAAGTGIAGLWVGGYYGGILGDIIADAIANQTITGAAMLEQDISTTAALFNQAFLVAQQDAVQLNDFNSMTTTQQASTIYGFFTTEFQRRADNSNPIQSGLAKALNNPMGFSNYTSNISTTAPAPGSTYTEVDISTSMMALDWSKHLRIIQTAMSLPCAIFLKEMF